MLPKSWLCQNWLDLNGDLITAKFIVALYLVIIYCKYVFEYLCEWDIFAEITTMWGFSKKNIANPLKHFYGVHVVNLLYLLCKNVIAPG